MILEGHPLGRLAWRFVEVLVFATSRLDGENYQVPLFPIQLVPIHNCGAFSLQDEQLNASLVTMPAGVDLDVLYEASPIGGGGIIHDPGGQETLDQGLSILPPGNIPGPDHNLTVPGTFPLRRGLPQ